MTTHPHIATNIDRIKSSIARAAEAAGRNAADITLIAVTKTYPVDYIKAAIAAGITDTGENRIQEAIPKIEELSADATILLPKWHLIGHLQSNKAKLAVQHFAVIHSVDSVKLAKEIDRHAEAAGKLMPILMQVNVSGEESKSGMHPKVVKDLIQEILESTRNVRIDGFMTMAPFETAEDARPHFKALHALRDRMSSEINSERFNPKELSMGMSNDYLVAVEEGATMVRIGSSIFSSRI